MFSSKSGTPKWDPFPRTPLKRVSLSNEDGDDNKKGKMQYAISDLPLASFSKRGLWWEAIDMKMIVYSHANKTYFQKEGFALSLDFKLRIFGTRKSACRFR